MSKTTIYDEVVGVTGLKPRKGEKPEAFADRLALAVDKLEDEDWKSLSEEAQNWQVAAIKAGDDKKPVPLPDGMPGAAAEEEPDVEDEEPEDGDIEGTGEEDDEEEPEADDDEPDEEPAEEEESVSAKSKGARGASKKAAASKKAPGGKSAPKGAAKKKVAAKATKKSSAKKAAAAGSNVRAKPPKASANGAAPRLGKRAQVEADARAGKMPPVPDFSAATHERWRPKLKEVVAMAKKGDVKGLKAYKITPYSTSPKAIDRYRQLAILALEAK